jgi:hypothetical protein
MVQGSKKEHIKHLCTQKKGMGSAVCVGGWACAISCQKGGCTHAWIQKCDPKSKFHYILFPNTFWAKTIPIRAKKRVVKICPLRTKCVGLFVGQ